MEESVTYRMSYSLILKAKVFYVFNDSSGGCLKKHRADFLR
jgi:hypothetical protein